MVRLITVSIYYSLSMSNAYPKKKKRRNQQLAVLTFGNDDDDGHNTTAFQNDVAR